MCRGGHQLKVVNYDRGGGRALDSPFSIGGVYLTGERWLLGELTPMRTGVCPWWSLRRP